MHRYGLVFLMALVLSACGDDVCDDIADEAELDLRMVSDELDIGSQGGFHLWLEHTPSGMCAEEASLAYEVLTADTHEVAASGVLRADAIGEPQAAVVCPSPLPTNLVNRQVLVRVTMRDHADRIAISERRVTLRCPSDHPDVETTCERVCDRTEH